jgi:hypothetical protein
MKFQRAAEDSSGAQVSSSMRDVFVERGAKIMKSTRLNDPSMLRKSNRCRREDRCNGGSNRIAKDRVMALLIAVDYRLR